MRRRDQDDELASLCEAFEGRHEQAQFADPLRIVQKLRQRRLRPATTRKCQVEIDKTAGDGLLDASFAVAAPEERVVQQLGEREFHGRRDPAPRQGCPEGTGQTGKIILSNDRSMRQQP